MLDLDLDYLSFQDPAEHPSGFLLIISGPSGAGKSTVVNEIMKTRSDMFFSISATTRPPREDEENGVHYYFLTRETFIEERDAGMFLEWAEFAGHFYGTPRDPVLRKIEQGYVVVLDVETQGAMRVMEAYPEAVSIFLTPSAVSEVETRLRTRGTETEEKIRHRMEHNREGFSHLEQYDYIIINDTLHIAISLFESILLAEQSRTKRLPELVNRLKTPEGESCETQGGR